MSDVQKGNNSDLLPCAWLVDDDGGRCGGNTFMSRSNGGAVRVECHDCGTFTGWCRKEPEARAEWIRNQRALLGDHLLSLKLKEAHERAALKCTEHEIYYTKKNQEEFAWAKERDELRQEVANHLAVATAFGAANRKVRAEFDSIRTALGPLASDDLVGDVARVVGWMAALHADDSYSARVNLDVVDEYRDAMKGKDDED